MRYVMLAVPAQLVPAVTEFIEQLGGPVDVEDLEGPADADALIHHWTPERLRESYRDTSDRMRLVLEYLAAHPGEELSSEQVAKGVGVTNGAQGLAGVLSGFGRTCKRQWGNTFFPWGIRRVDGRIRMQMPDDVAEVVREIARTSP